jgi:hypothetical protein
MSNDSDKYLRLDETYGLIKTWSGPQIGQTMPNGTVVPQQASKKSALRKGHSSSVKTPEAPY